MVRALLACQSGVWTSNTACPQYSGDLNVLEGLAGTKSCVNGAGMGNAPTADWYFIDTYRHVNGNNYYAVQTANAMTGTNVGKPYTRVQQSGSAGTGWGSWQTTTVKGLGWGGTTWNDVTGSRSQGTVYYNPYPYPISVSISFGTTNDQGWSFYINGLQVGYLHEHQDFNGAWEGGIVPVGGSYVFYGNYVFSWAELY